MLKKLFRRQPSFYRCPLLFEVVNYLIELKVQFFFNILETSDIQARQPSDAAFDSDSSQPATQQQVRGGRPPRLSRFQTKLFSRIFQFSLIVFFPQ